MARRSWQCWADHHKSTHHHHHLLSAPDKQFSVFLSQFCAVGILTSWQSYGGFIVQGFEQFGSQWKPGIWPWYVSIACGLVSSSLLMNCQNYCLFLSAARTVKQFCHGVQSSDKLSSKNLAADEGPFVEVIWAYLFPYLLHLLLPLRRIFILKNSFCWWKQLWLQIDCG
jgi:hypothetical protein